MVRFSVACLLILAAVLFGCKGGTSSRHTCSATTNSCQSTWVYAFERSIGRAISLQAEAASLRESLKDSGYFASEPDGSLQWWSEANAKTRSVALRLGQVRAALWQTLVHLWITSGYGKPIIGHSRSDIDLVAAKVIDEYRQWLRDVAARRPIQVLATDLLDQNVEALDDGYYLPALMAIEKWVLFSHPFYPLAEPGHIGLVPEDSMVEQISRMRAWYDANVDRLHWDERRCMFTAPDGRAFQR